MGFRVGLGPATKVRACRKRFQRLFTVVTKELLSQKRHKEYIGKALYLNTVIRMVIIRGVVGYTLR